MAKQKDDYFQLHEDVLLEKDRMDEAFDALGKKDKTSIRKVSRNLTHNGEKVAGLGHYGLLELLNKLGLFDQASAVTGSKSPELRDRKTVKASFEGVEVE